jgi:hypothetical protein
MKRITVTMLRGACNDQRKLFRKTFPDGAPVTLAAARKALKAGLAVFWMCTLLPKSLYDEYYAKCKPLDYEYYAKCKPLDDEYYAKRKPLYDEYYAKRLKLLVSLLRRVEVKDED